MESDTFIIQVEVSQANNRKVINEPKSLRFLRRHLERNWTKKPFTRSITIQLWSSLSASVLASLKLFLCDEVQKAEDEERKKFPCLVWRRMKNFSFFFLLSSFFSFLKFAVSFYQGYCSKGVSSSTIRRKLWEKESVRTFLGKKRSQ